MGDEGKVTGASEVTIEDLKAFADAWDRHDVDTIMTFFTDDCVFVAGWGERFVGKERVQEGVSEFFAKFPDGRFSDGHHFISGDRGVSEWTFTATGPDGVTLMMTGCDLFAFENGKIAVKNAFRKDRISRRDLVSDQQKLTGGCLCGAVRYETVGKPLQVAHCHCERCRRSTGAAFATGVCFPVEAVTWKQGEPASYQSSASFARLFCSHCGSSVAQQNLAAGTMWPLAGTLDRPDSVTPEFHMFIEEQLSWTKLDDGLPRYSTFAPTRSGKEEDE